MYNDFYVLTPYKCVMVFLNALVKAHPQHKVNPLLYEIKKTSCMTMMFLCKKTCINLKIYEL